MVNCVPLADMQVAFVSDYLPSIGKKAGANGYSWKQALTDFEILHPEYRGKYTDVVSFQKSVKQAINRRKGR